jgi:hypothetical protein
LSGEWTCGWRTHGRFDFKIGSPKCIGVRQLKR